MPGPQREPTITLVGGPWDRQVYYASDWEDTRQAAERMGRTADEFCGWPLAYRPEMPGSSRWVWAAGQDWPAKRPAGERD
ncbi:hypothetical protein [Kribbella sp. NPDC055071]